MDSERDPITQFFTPAELSSPSQSPNSILYTVLNIGPDYRSTLTPDILKKAYRTSALKWHPDKHASKGDEEKEVASVEFLKVGFAFEVLSDEGRRKTYDRTGSTATNAMSADAAAAGGWEAYFKGMYTKVDKSVLDEDKRVYQGSDEELADLHAVYLSSSGHLPTIMDSIPHSTTTNDETRFVTLLNEAISSGTIPLKPKWEKSSKDTKARTRRLGKEKKEAREAEEYAKELGVWEEFYGNKEGSGEAGASSEAGPSSEAKGNGNVKKRKTAGTGDAEASTKKTKSSPGGGMDDEYGDVSGLAAIIARRQASRESQSDALLAKYSGGTKEKNGLSGKSKVKGKANGKANKGGKGKTFQVDPNEDEENWEEEDEAMDEEESAKAKAAMPSDAEFEALQAKMFADKGKGSKEGKKPKILERKSDRTNGKAKATKNRN